MSTTSTDRPTDAASPHYSRSLLLLLATIAGVSVANIYYNQPLLDSFRSAFPDGASWIGAVPTATQLGYAAGMFLLAPLGDRFDRRRVIVTKAAALVVALLLAAVAPSLGLLLAASFAIGLAATMAQDVVPAAATLAHDAHRGRIVGTVMTGLLLGILLSRVVAGFVAETIGWRAMFALAAASVAAIGIVAARGLPRFEPTTRLPYRALI
ncbi:MFS transporter, partial [Burkholderia stabilis]